MVLQMTVQRIQLSFLEESQLLLNPGKYKFTLILYATDDKNGDLSVTLEFDFADIIVTSADDEAVVKDKIGGYSVKASLFREIGIQKII